MNEEITKITKGGTEESYHAYCSVEINGDKVNVGFDYYGDEGVSVTEYECENDSEIVHTLIYAIMSDCEDLEPGAEIDKGKEQGKIKQIY